MMKPLRQSAVDDDPEVARAAALLAGMRPLEMLPGARQRVRAAVRARRAQRGGAWRTVFAVAVLAVLVGTASAWVARRLRAAPIAPTPAPAPVPSSTPPPAPPDPPPAARPIAPATTRATAAPPPRQRHAPNEDPETALVVRAIKRLRRDHDAKAAAALLEQCTRRYPNGILHEEAQALRVEAAAQLDPRVARALADEYLARYPNGRFRADVTRFAGGAK